MIEFFEMLNEVSALRTIAYLVFILAFTFIIFAGISDIIYAITGTKHKSREGGETESEAGADPNSPWNWKTTEDRVDDE